MAEPKTRPTDASVEAFIDAVPGPRRRTEGFELLELFIEATGAKAVMWGPSIVGFGSMLHRNTTGEWAWPVVGFSPRKAALTVYGVHDGDGPHDPLLDSLGPHTLSKACLYITRLDRVDKGVLTELIRNAWGQVR
jgi:hypothetical protein